MFKKKVQWIRADSSLTRQLGSVHVLFLQFGSLKQEQHFIKDRFNLCKVFYMSFPDNQIDTVTVMLS